MLEFLIDLGINENVICDLENTYPENILYSLEANSLEVEKTINYLKKIGIEVINELLIFELTIFLLTFREIKDIFNKYDIKEVVNKINNDYMYIEEII